MTSIQTHENHAAFTHFDLRAAFFCSVSYMVWAKAGWQTG